MRNLERVLNEFNPVTMGAARTPNRPDLQKRLAALSARNAIYFRLGVGMVLVCYVGLFVVAWFHRADVATFVPLIFAAAGLTWWVVSLWREKACARLRSADTTECTARLVFPWSVLQSVCVTVGKAS
jgi:hypothetical protein